MKKDAKNELLLSIKILLSSVSDTNELEMKITLLLNNYDIFEKSTELALPNNSNVQLIKIYASAIIIDGKAQSTVRHYVEELNKFNILLDGKDLKKVTPFDVRSYLVQRKLDGLSNRTLDHVRSILVAFYSWLVAEDYVGKNPCRNIKPIKYQEEIKIPYTQVELDKIRSACKNQRERAIIEFLLSTGVRVSEFCALNVEDIDMDKKIVKINHGKGNKERYTYFNDLTKEHLSKYLGDRTTGSLFITQKKGRYSKGGVRYLLHSIGNRANVDNVHPHRFRRTFATTLSLRGMKLQEIQKLMGHSDINTTMVYVSLNDMQINNSYTKYSF